MLTLPVTIRIPTASELPHRDDIQELLAKRKAANITEGYIIHPNKTPQLHFEFSAEININNNKLWELFLTLAGDMPGEISCTYGLYDDEAITTDPFPFEDIIRKLTVFHKELTMDCSLEFGLLHHTKEVLTEIFVSESKYIKYWGGNKTRFLQHMNNFNLTEVPNIAFIDEYPKIIRPLRDFIPSARKPEEVIWGLNRAFQVEN